MSNPIILHVNYVEQGQTILEMCQKAVKWGYDGIEFRRKRSGIDETPDQYIDSIASAVDATGLKHVLFGGGPNLMDSNEGVRKREVEEYLSFFEKALKKFRLTVCNSFTGTLNAAGVPYAEYDRNGSMVATEEQWNWAVAGFQTIGDFADKHGFKLAFETHNCYLHDLATPTRKLVDRIHRKSVGINFDYGNIMIHPNGETLADALKICGDKIYEVHFKNGIMLPNRKYYPYYCCPLADGVINHREYLKILKKMNYQGPYGLEAPRGGDREWFAREDLRYFKSLLEEVG